MYLVHPCARPVNVAHPALPIQGVLRSRRFHWRWTRGPFGLRQHQSISGSISGRRQEAAARSCCGRCSGACSSADVGRLKYS